MDINKFEKISENSKILWVDEKRIYLSKKTFLIRFTEGSECFIFKFKSDCFVKDIFRHNRLLRRLSRSLFHHLQLSNSGLYFLIFVGKEVLLLDVENSTVAHRSKVFGSRPLAIDTLHDCFFYGEYKSNVNRNPIHIWRMNSENMNWENVWEFNSIRHIHGVFKDPFSDFLWVTTGDSDSESGIWCFDKNFETCEKIVGGNQQTRAVSLLFDDDFVYFGSDTPLEKNFIYRFDRANRKINLLQEVGGSVFHSCKVATWFFFSTAVEPSTVNNSPYAEVWASPNGEYWKCILRFKKDFLSKKYFQYGQVFFPAGPGDGKNLWITPFATHFDQMTFKIPLKKIEKEFFNNE
jgi:hypothetical protein